MQVESSTDDSLSRLMRRISGVVFCGTPHRGSSKAAWASTLSKLMAAALIDANTEILNDLDAGSQILDMIQDDFLRTIEFSPSLRVHSFIEGKAMTGIRGLNDKVCDFAQLRRCYKPPENYVSKLHGHISVELHAIYTDRTSDTFRWWMTSRESLAGPKEAGLKPLMQIIAIWSKRRA
jgi:hypothetical protein